MIAKPPILEVVCERVELRRAGKQWKGLCPFHFEKKSSFFVDESRERFHCYGCLADGDVIDFLMKLDKLSFAEALRALGIHSEGGRRLTEAEKAARSESVEAKRRASESEQAQLHARVAKKAAAIWTSARPAHETHSYLARKRVKPHGVKLYKGSSVIPVRDCGGNLHSLQFIDAIGRKRFLENGRVAGCHFAIGNPEGAAALCIAEGFATGATIHEATGFPVAVAFHCGNLEKVARAMRQKFPDLRLIICADDDAATHGNPGMTKAKEAARVCGGLVAMPHFDNKLSNGY